MSLQQWICSILSRHKFFSLFQYFYTWSESKTWHESVRNPYHCSVLHQDQKTNAQKVERVTTEIWREVLRGVKIVLVIKRILIKKHFMYHLPYSDKCSALKALWEWIPSNNVCLFLPSFKSKPQLCIWQRKGEHFVHLLGALGFDEGFKGNLKAKLLLTFWFSLNLIHSYFCKGLMVGWETLFPCSSIWQGTSFSSLWHSC